MCQIVFPSSSSDNHTSFLKSSGCICNSLAQSHILTSSLILPLFTTLCQAFCPCWSCLKSNSFLKSAGVTLALSQTHNFSASSMLPFSMACCKAVLLNSSCDRSNLYVWVAATISAHSHIASNACTLLYFAAVCQAVRNVPPSVKIIIFIWSESCLDCRLSSKNPIIRELFCLAASFSAVVSSFLLFNCSSRWSP